MPLSIFPAQSHTRTNINFAVYKAYETKSLKELVNAPVAAIQGVS